jgi:hypothetical protein
VNHSLEPKPNMSELYIFPLLQKYNTENGVDLDAIPKEEIDKLSYHYMKQLVKLLKLHGFTVDTKFLKDFDLVHEALKSTISRAVGKFHPLQDYIDSLEELKSAIAKQEKPEETN